MGKLRLRGKTAEITKLPFSGEERERLYESEDQILLFLSLQLGDAHITVSTLDWWMSLQSIPRPSFPKHSVTLKLLLFDHNKMAMAATPTTNAP